jgi:hypothetical protein
MKRLFVLVTLAFAGLQAQIPAGYYPYTPYVSWYVGSTVVPGTPTAVPVPKLPGGAPAPPTVFVEMVVLANVSSSSVTVAITDGSTNCNGGPCTLFPAATIQSNQAYTVPLNGAPANGGIIWSASAANAIHASIRGRY